MKSTKKSRVSPTLVFTDYSAPGVTIGPVEPDVVTTSHTANFSSSATGFVYFTIFHLL